MAVVLSLNSLTAQQAVQAPLRGRRLHDNKSGTGDQIMGFEKTVDGGFRHKVALGIGEGHSQLTRTELELL